MFRFKQFNVDQTGCAMKINTDGVLLGAMTAANEPTSILDIGTGTGVIALMLAQRYVDAQIDGVEIDEEAARTAKSNFNNSPFADRLKIFPLNFETFFEQFPERKYDVIVSNPPFYVDSLKSPKQNKTLAKHTDINFFKNLIESSSRHLTADGCFWMIFPVNILDTITDLAEDCSLQLQKIIKIKSYADSLPHRVILCLGFEMNVPEIITFTIYKSKDTYTEEYGHFLRPYFLAF